MKNLKFRARDLKLNKFIYFDLSTCLPIYGNSEEFAVDVYTGFDCRYTNQPLFTGDYISPWGGDSKLLIDNAEGSFILNNLGETLGYIAFITGNNLKYTGNKYEN